MERKIEQSLFNAKWAWNGISAFDSNKFVAFRRNFNYNGGKVALKITADSVYTLYLNGVFVGLGPVRAYPFSWHYDEYDLSHLVINGKNSLSVLVNHFGISTFHYILAPGGLLAEFSLDGEKTYTPNLWRARECAEYNTHTAKISCQQQYEEQYDARLYDGWRETNYNDSDWNNAIALRPACDGAHDNFLPRPIPNLTAEPFFPFRVAEQSIVQLNHYISFDIGSLLKNDEFGDTPYLIDCAFALIVESKKAKVLKIVWKELFNNIMVNGETADGELNLKEGDNLITFYERGVRHATQATLCYSDEIKIKKLYLLGPYNPIGEDDKYEKCDIGYYRIIDGVRNAGIRAQTLKDITVENIADNKYAKDFSLHLHNKNAFAESYKCSREIVDAGAKLESLNNGMCELSANGKDFGVLLDFNKEFVGNITFKVFAPAGTEVYLHFFEFIQPDGRKNFAEGMSNALRFVCSGGEDDFRSTIRRGGRYVHFIFSGAKSVKLGNVRLYNSTYPQARRGEYFGSDYLYNYIYECSADTIRCCMEDTYTDCPTYEQTYWVGDMRNEALVDYALNGDNRLWKRCILLAGQSLNYSDVVLSQVPSGWWNILPAWTMLWMQSVSEYYTFSGDEIGVREALPFLKKNFEGIKKNITANGLVKIDGWNMFDWAAMHTPTDGIVAHVNFLAAFALKNNIETLRALGENEFANECEQVRNKIIKAANEEFWSDEASAYVDCIDSGKKSTVISQQTQVAALLAGAATGNKKKFCLEKVLNPDGIVTSGSPFFTFFLLEVLANESYVCQQDGNKAGASKYQLRLLKEIKDNWGMMTNSGCNTFWEQWGVIVDGRMTRSHCHGWSAAPAHFFAQYVLGVKPLEPGYKTFSVNPHLGEQTFCRGKVPTPYGAIEISITDCGKKILCRHPNGTKLIIDKLNKIITEQY